MKSIQSKTRRLNLQVRSSAGAQQESDLDAHSSPLTEDELSEVAAYGATRSCEGWTHIIGPGVPVPPGAVLPR
jgi:hypothetical protein